MSNDLVRKTTRTVGIMTNYGGICEQCGGQVGRAGDVVVVELCEWENDLARYFVPIDLFECPHCGHRMDVIRIWKSMNVTKELEGIKKDG